MSEKYEYQVPLEVLDAHIDKLTRGILPMVDDITMKEIEIRMHELTSDLEDELDDDENVANLIHDTEALKQKASESSRKATKTDVAIFTLTDEQKATLRDEMSVAFVRSEISDYNRSDDDLADDEEKRILKKRVSRIRRCYYHPEEWRSAIQTILDVIEYDAQSYPWMDKKEYMRAIQTGQIKINVLVPILFIDYHTPILDPELLISIFNGETIIEDKQEIDKSNKVRAKDDKVVYMKGIQFTDAEVKNMQNLSASGFDTPLNEIFKGTHKNIYDRFLPTSKSEKIPKGIIREFLKEIKTAKKYNGVDVVPYNTNDIVSFIHQANPGELNTSINSAMTKFMASLQTNPTPKIDTSFRANEVLVNAQAAAKEANILANIKSIHNNTKK